MRAKIEGAVNSKKAIDDENRSLLEQEHIYDTIIGKQGKTDTNAPSSINSTLPTASAANTANNVIPITTTQPLPITTDIITVKQSELFLVSDTGVYSALDTSTSRLETKLDSVIRSLQDSADKVARSISALDTSLKRNNTRGNTNIVSP